MFSPRRLFLILLLSAGVSRAQAPVRPTGVSITGLPALSFDADEGAGYGALLQFYDYGVEGASPYRYSLQPQLLFTTRGRRDVVLFVDAPHLLGNGWRMSGLVGRQQQLATPYYGVGNNTVNDPTAVTTANPYFYRFGRTLLLANADAQHPVWIPQLRLLMGMGARDATVRTTPYDSGTTLLASQLGSGDLPARRTVYARTGVVLDTRDREIGTTSGTWSEFLVQRAGKVAGGDEAYTRITGTLRGFVPVASSLVLAERVVMQTVRGDLPVTDLSYVQSSYRDDEALGGATSIRGVPRNRYVGKGLEFSNTELRWSAAQFDVSGHRVSLVTAAFADVGRVWDNGFDASGMLSDLHAGYGGGLHVGVGPSFIITGDVGHSSETTAAIYLGVGYLF